MGGLNIKLQICCQQCFKNGLEQDKNKVCPYVPSYPYLEFPIIELEKWPYIEMECKNGHKQRFTIELELYELLFQQATYCIMDGYYREAVCTYNSALERFFEYTIEILSLKYNKDLDFENLWKSIKNQSERQLGAFYFLWATYFKENPTFLDENKVKIRNAVIHKGNLVSKEVSMEFGKYVFDYLRSAKKKLEVSLGAELFYLNFLRKYRICRGDFEKAQQNPIKLVEDGKELYTGIGCMSIPCFLNSEEVENFEICFTTHKMDGYGLLK